MWSLSQEISGLCQRFLIDEAQMIVDLTEEEIRILRAVLIGKGPKAEILSQITRERIVLKLHAALEESLGNDASEHSSTSQVQ